VARPSGERTLRKLDVDRLLDAGVLQRIGSGTGSRVRIPRLVRQYLARRRWSLEPTRASEESRWLANQHGGKASAEETIERHHHAVLGGDVDQALASARYYGTDLRQLAYRLSMERRFGEAAEIYRAIVEQYDDQDAYAWEYLGYNMARADVAGPGAGRYREVRAAYDRAHRLDAENPLYHGRLVGLDAEQGEDVLPIFARALRIYESTVGDSGVSYFAKPILAGLRRAGCHAALQEIQHRWGRRLAGLGELQPYLDQE
jgi:tetratricopeptide (TPR) repeat protein